MNQSDFLLECHLQAKGVYVVFLILFVLLIFVVINSVVPVSCCQPNVGWQNDIDRHQSCWGHAFSSTNKIGSTMALTGATDGEPLGQVRPLYNRQLYDDELSPGHVNRKSIAFKDDELSAAYLLFLLESRYTS